MECREYRLWVSSLPCCVSDMSGPGIDPHHIVGYNWLTGKCASKKATDITCIPLRSDLHAELHRGGHESFEKDNNISQLEVMIKTILLAEREGILKIDKKLAKSLAL